MSGYVYVVKNKNNNYKIGYTNTSIDKRINALKTSSDSNIHLVFSFLSEEPKLLEQSLHSKFATKRLNGEWFSLDDNDIISISQMKDAERDNHSSSVQMNQDFLKEFSARRDIGLEVYRVFTYLNARLDFENVIQIQQTEIAEHLGMHKQSVHKAVKQLEALGVILRGPKVGRCSSWRLNPMAGWKGKITNLRTAQRDHLHLIHSKPSHDA